MGRLQVKSSILLCWALTLMFSAAQREYFIQSTSRTWSDARNYCQACFKELVTLTPDNTHYIARIITSDHWIGLRKNFNISNSTDSLTSTPASYTVSYSTMYYSNSNFTSNDTSRPIFNWTQWANGDPLAFQNWYPGWPIPKPSPKRPNKTLCCSCSCTCPARTTTAATTAATTPNTTRFNNTGNITDTVTSFTDLTGNTFDFTSDGNFSSVTDQTMTTQRTSASFTTSAPWTTTQMPIEAECVRSPMVNPVEPEDNNTNDVNYIEDSCVAMLSFGPWIERNCLDLLPFICYEDRFIGQVNVTNATSEHASLKWLQAPGDISNYSVQITELKNGPANNTWAFNVTNLTAELNNLTAGTRYSVQVIPVKCERKLNPAVQSFYTTPNQVVNLTVYDVTVNSVSLNWNKPNGNLDFYNLTYEMVLPNKTTKTIEVIVQTERTVVDGLLPGTLYNFTVISGVNDRSKWSDEVNISAYTKPDKVYNLAVSNNTDKSLVVTWNRPNGGFRDIVVVATNSSNYTFFNNTLSDDGGNNQTVNVTGLPPGAEIHIYVTVRLTDAMVGETQTTCNFTTPGPISNLDLTPTADSLVATWSPPNSSYSSFTVKLYLDRNNITEINRTETNVIFTSLKNAANYTVEVRAVSGIFKSSAVNASIFTLPNRPTNVKATQIQSDRITFTWTAPANTHAPSYNVTLNSSFWGEMWSDQTSNTAYTFSGLKSGTNYVFEVSTVAGGLKSEATGCSNYTVADIREISLAMLCSSTTALKCDNITTRQSVFDQLKQHFGQLLNGQIYWDLQETFK